MMVRSVLSLIFIVGLVGLGSWVLKKYVQKNRKGKGLPVKIVGSTYLDPKKSIYLVDVEDKRLVLGVTDAAITFLTELEKKPESEEMIPSETGHSSGVGFKEMLNTLLKKRGGND